MTPDHVSFPALGQYGRLGNALFQVAATCAHAWRLGLEPRFPAWEWAEPLGLPEEWFTMVPSIAPEDVCYDAPWNYAPIPESARVLHGYFQSPKFWEGYEDNILSWFDARTLLGNSILTIHVRRGDYLRLPQHHPIPDPERYYNAAMRRIQSLPDFDLDEPASIVSDDPEWCVRTFRPALVSTAGEIADLTRMTSSRYLIIANSSFSWWGAYLAMQAHCEKVIYPKQWFGPALADHDVSQLFLPEWGWVGI